MNIAALILPAAAAALPILGPYNAANNFATNTYGPVDTRPETWGNAQAVSWPVKFTVPPGYRVRVLKITGDLVAWPLVLPGDAPVKDGAYAGVLVGFQTTAKEGSDKCSPCADNTFVYVQGALQNGAAVRIPFSQTVDAGGILDSDNIMVVKAASWLNTTGKPIHMEVTYTMTYQYEPIN